LISSAIQTVTDRRAIVLAVSVIGIIALAGLSLTIHWTAPLAIVTLVAGVVAFLRWPWLGLTLLIASVPLQQLGAVGPATATRASIPLAVVGYLLWLTTHRRPLVLTRFAIPFGAWMCWMFSTLSIADDLGAGMSELTRWTIAFGAFLIAVQFLVGAPRSRIVAVVMFMAIAGALEATVGTILSLLAVGPASFRVSDAFARAYGTFGRPNTFAGYLEMTVFPVAWLAVDEARRSWPQLRAYIEARRHGMIASQRVRQRLIMTIVTTVVLAGSSVIMLAGVTASYSRGAWLGVVIGAGFSALLFLRRAWLVVVAAAPIAIILLTTMVASVAPAELTERLTSITDEVLPFDASTILVTGDNFAVVERMAHWQAGWRMFNDAPLAGVGVGNFNTAYPDYFVRSNFQTSQGHAHNYYIQVLAETGIVGLVLYLTLAVGFLFLGIYVAWNAPSGTARFLALGAVGSMTAVMVHNVFENLHVLNLGIQISAVWALTIAAHTLWRMEPTARYDSNMEYSRE